MKDHKPTWDEVYKLCLEAVKFQIRRFAFNMSQEHHEEMRQDALTRVWNAYKTIDSKSNWKAFVRIHSAGAVIDYLRAGNGVEERSKSNLGSEKSEFKVRVEIEDMNTEQVMGLFGKSEEPTIDQEKIVWPLVARMARHDINVHMLAKYLLGFTQEQISVDGVCISRERVSQRIANFIKRLDDPRFYHNRWVKQTIYAFGLCDYFHMTPKDQEIGWDYEPVDLFSDDSINSTMTRQLTMEIH